MRTVKDIVFVAGYLEGEGSFLIANGSPKISFATTDFDIAKRVTHLLSGWNKRVTEQPKLNQKTIYHSSIYGDQAISWMMTIYIFLGERRRERVREVIAIWKIKKSRWQRSYCSTNERQRA